ncbi:Non-specific serine/threonine protein kinase protein [Dioscorea alata]|uniref:Non-specific serine/threonine protein kinase protein n=1 Tax=Dioscorea alata TaxID=55571 RepID=A0ACB7UER1_DIOAL|nr:Non-specific serine/threonine protein kinase protein [Dioscorea alata]
MKPPEQSETLEELASENEAEEPQTLESQIEEPVSRVLQSGTLGTVGSNPAFLVGNFVWGRVRTHPWWPGRVREPELAVAAKRAVRKAPNSVFVSYFGDESYAWCQPMHLKPFKQEFAQMMAQSVSKGFVSAVRSALEEIGRCVEVEMACGCVDIEIPDGFLKQGSKEFAITGYAPAEFLQLVRDVAKNCMVVDMLEITVLRSWVFAFNRKSGHQQCGVVDLVDKLDLDVENDGMGDSWIDAPRKPEISEEKYKRRKKRSMAKLIAEMDLNAVEVSDDVDSVVEEEEKDNDVVVEEEEKHDVEEKIDNNVEEEEKHEEEEKGNDVVVEEEEKKHEDDENVNAKIVDGAVVVGEGTGSGKRERKKSKYLSYPYAHLSGIHGKQSVFLLGDFEVKTSKKAKVDLSDKEEDQKDLVLKLESISTSEILSEFLAAARDSLHLKWNRSAKTVRGFFAAYRSAFYSESSDFEAHQKKLAECGCLNRKITDDVKSNQSKEDLGIPKRNSSGKTQGKKAKQSEDREGTLLHVGHPKSNLTAPSLNQLKKRMRIEGTNVQSVAHVPVETMNSSEEAKKSMMVLTNGKPSADVAEELLESPKVKKSRKKRRKIKEDLDSKALTDLNLDASNGSGESWKKQKKTDENNSEGPAALLLSFTPGVNLPSRDEIVAAFSKYGSLNETDTEVMKDSGCARLVFMKSLDAENALHSRDKTGVFAPPNASYRVRYLPVNPSSPPSSAAAANLIPDRPLPYIRKNLEQMISTLTSPLVSDKDAGSSDELKPGAKENLVGEMQGLLEKVNKLLNGPPAGSSS